MVELNGHDAVVAEDAEVFGKGESHFGFVVAVGEFFRCNSFISWSTGWTAHPTEARGVSDSFAIFVGKFGKVEFRKDVT